MRYIFLLIFALITGCGREKAVSLRPIPYPYRAALAISSDCDKTDSLGEFLTIMRYLNTTDSTPIGRGLGLEIGYSFWFFDALHSTRFTVFKDTSFELSSAAKTIVKFIRAGYIDYLHTFGEFSLGGFIREFAESAVAFIKRNNLKLLTWINHGPPTNHQNVGPLSFQLGDNPGSPYYVSDLLKSVGFKFFGFYEVCHTVGQDGKRRFINYLKALKDAQAYLTGVHHWLLGFYLRNHLLEPAKLDDGYKVFHFVRYMSSMGRVAHANAEALPRQLSPQVIEELERKGSYMIVYTHLGDNLGPPEYFSDSTKKTLEHLAKEFHEGRLLVTTTTRLLVLNLVERHLNWHYKVENGKVMIFIDGIKANWKPEEDDFQGLTFYTPAPESTEVYIFGKKVKDVVVNPPDFTGRGSVSIQWRPLKFPEGL